jgi:hypothetical protein
MMQIPYPHPGCPEDFLTPRVSDGPRVWSRGKDIKHPGSSRCSDTRGYLGLPYTPGVRRTPGVWMVQGHPNTRGRRAAPTPGV